MGNKLGRRRQVVDERFTKPQGLYVHKDVDHKKLRKLIIESKLAPCFPGDEECCFDHEECPICFLYYPSLNRSRCCMKRICTECFLQMKNPNSTRPTQCPFCKNSNYAVEYRGVKTKEEKGLEQIEEQRVIEAKIRIQQQEVQDEEERMQKRLEVCSSSSSIVSGEVECGSSTVLSCRSPVDCEEIVSSQNSIRRPPPSGVNREDEFDLDLEDIMVMEAIWLSIQENGRQRNPIYGDATSSMQYPTEARYASPMTEAPLAGSSSSPSGGLACAIASLAERQQTGGEASVQNNENLPSFNILPERSSFYNHLDCGAANYSLAQCSSHVTPDCRITTSRDDGEWCARRGSDAAEARTSFASSDTVEDSDGMFAILPPPPPPPPPPDAAEARTSYASSDTVEDLDGMFAILPPPPPPPPDETAESFQNVSGPIGPESFEEQMMLAMAVSLAEARTDKRIW